MSDDVQGLQVGELVYMVGNDRIGDHHTKKGRAKSLPGRVAKIQERRGELARKLTGVISTVPVNWGTPFSRQSQETALLNGRRNFEQALARLSLYVSRMSLAKLDQWIGTTLFIPPIIKFCQLTRQSHYACSRLFWFFPGSTACTMPAQLVGTFSWVV